MNEKDMEDKIADKSEKTPLLENGNQEKISECPFYTPVEDVKNSKARNKLIVASVICLVFIVAEVIGGILANSLAILTDSAHLFCDFGSFMVSLLAMWLGNKANSKTMTFGWHRAEILGALVSVLIIWLVTAILVYLAILRIIDSSFNIDGRLMLIMSALAVIINIIMAVVLDPHSHVFHHFHKNDHDCHNHSSDSCQKATLSPDYIECNDVHSTDEKPKVENINLRAAFIHVIGDILQSLGVLIASCIIYFKPQWKIADPLCTFLFSGLIVLTTLSIFADVICVLLERKPQNLNYEDVKNKILGIPGVIGCHNLRLWSITLSMSAASCHIIIDDRSDYKQILDTAHDIFIKDFFLSEVVIQIEMVKDE